MVGSSARGVRGCTRARVEKLRNGRRTGAPAEDGRAAPELADPRTTWGFGDRRTSTRVHAFSPSSFPSFSTPCPPILSAVSFFIPRTRSSLAARTWVPPLSRPFSFLSFGRLFPFLESFFTDRPVVFSRPFNLSSAATFLHSWTGLGHWIGSWVKRFPLLGVTEPRFSQ